MGSDAPLFLSSNHEGISIACRMLSEVRLVKAGAAQPIPTFLRSNETNRDNIRSSRSQSNRIFFFFVERARALGTKSVNARSSPNNRIINDELLPRRKQFRPSILHRWRESNQSVSRTFVVVRTKRGEMEHNHLFFLPLGNISPWHLYERPHYKHFLFTCSFCSSLALYGVERGGKRSNWFKPTKRVGNFFF